MLDFSKVEAPQKLNRDFILSKISDCMIFRYYFGEFNMKSLYRSKFYSGKNRDNNHSTGFYLSSSGKLIYNHLNGKEPKMDCFAFVQRLYNCDFSDVLKRVAGDFGLVSGNPKPIAAKAMADLVDFDRTIKDDTRIHFRPAKWDSDTLPYWKQYGITKEELVREGVYPVKDLYINDKLISNNTNDLRYALTVPCKDELRTKLYCPDSDNFKWLSNIPLDLPFGIKTLDWSAPFSCGAKAQKDRMVLMKFLRAVYGSQNESYSALNPKFKMKLKFNFSKNYLMWDPDETGLMAMGELILEDFEPCHVHVDIYEQEDIKDYSDLAKEKGLKAVEQLLKQYELI